MQEQTEDLQEMKESCTFLSDENLVLHQKNQEIESTNKELHDCNEEFNTKICNLRSMLEDSQFVVELKKQQEEKTMLELKSTIEKLNVSNNNSNLLTEKLSERDGNEQVLCAEITQLQYENEKLNKTMVDLEATILQLDGDINESKGNLNKYKIHEDELQKGLTKANEEKEEIKNVIMEMEQVLKTFGESSNTRRKSREQGN